MKHKPMRTEKRWAYIVDGQLRKLAHPSIVTESEAWSMAYPTEDVQRVEIRLVPKRKAVPRG